MDELLPSGSNHEGTELEKLEFNEVLDEEVGIYFPLLSCLSLFTHAAYMHNSTKCEVALSDKLTHSHVYLI